MNSYVIRDRKDVFILLIDNRYFSNNIFMDIQNHIMKKYHDFWICIFQQPICASTFASGYGYNTFNAILLPAVSTIRTCSRRSSRA